MMFDKYLVWVCTKWMLKSILVQNCTITMKVVIFDTYLVQISTKWISKSVLVQIHTMSMKVVTFDTYLVRICTKSKSVLVQIHTMSMNIDIGMDCSRVISGMPSYWILMELKNLNSIKCLFNESKISISISSLVFSH